jgi:hypothetical protein
MAADFTIADVLEWARTKPARETYNFCDPDNCAAAQFGRATGRDYLIGVGDLRRIDHDLWRAVIGNEGDQSFDRYTFGPLVKRLEALLPSDRWTKANAYLADIEQVTA